MVSRSPFPTATTRESTDSPICTPSGPDARIRPRCRPYAPPKGELMIVRSLRLALLLSLAAFTITALVPSVAQAQDAALETARKEFERGQDLFEKGDFTNAA